MKGKRKEGIGHIGKKVRRRRLVAAFVLFLSLALHQREAKADLVNGFLEWDYTGATMTTRDAAGASTATKADSLIQKYNLSLNVNPYRLLRFSAGTLIESDKSWGEINGASSKSSNFIFLPSAELALTNSLFSSSIGYSRRQQTTSGAGLPSLTKVNEDYHGILSWKPEKMPSVSLVASRTNNYDLDRKETDITSDRFALGLRYLPVDNVDLRYQLTHSEVTDRLTELKTIQTEQSGRVNYTDHFWKQRVAVDASYGVVMQTTTALSDGKGLVEFPLTPFAALYALNDTPTVGVLNQFPALIDGNLTTSAGIGIGVQPSPTPAGDSRRNIGLDFLTPAELSRLEVWVDRDLAPVATSFHWALFTSTDGQIWSQLPPATQVTFGPLQNRFILDFAPVTTRYIKVVVSPLALTDVAGIPSFQNPGVINVTELKAFDERPAASTQRETSTTSHVASIDVKTKLLDSPYVLHDASLIYSLAEPDGASKYTLTNNLILNHNFSDTLSVSARGGREDGEEASGRRTAYTAGASLTANPLKTLSHTLAYSGRLDQIGGKNNMSNSIYLNNNIELYRGVSLTAGTGASYLTNDRGDKSRSLNLVFGANIAPRRDLSLGVYYTASKVAMTSGVTLLDTDTTSQRADFSASYRPFAALYLSTSLSILAQKGQETDVSQNYGINWAPFADGALKFGFSYNQSLRNINGESSRIITPSATWQITQRTLLQLSAPWMKSESVQGSSDSKVIGVLLRTSF